jgi:HEAT repeat protein
MNTRKAILVLLAVLGVLAAGSILQANETTVAALVAGLASSDEAAKLHAVSELGARGPNAAEAVGPLTKLLTDDSAKVRAHAADALGKIGEPARSAVPDLIKLVKDSDQTVRRQAVKAIIRIHPGPKVTVPLAVGLLKDVDPAVRMNVLSAIAEAGPKAVPALIEALNDDKAAYWACLVLREIGPAAKDAVPALIEKLKDSDAEIRREVILTLAAMGDEAVSAVPHICAALGDKETCTAATYALGRIGQIPERCDATIRANVKSDDKLLSTTSLWALARIHPEDKELRRETTVQLIAMLREADPFVRAAAARALAELPPAPEITIPIWEKELQNADATTVQYALDALARLGSQGVPRLVDALRHEKLRANVVAVLEQIGPDAAAATPALTALIGDKDDRVSHEAVLALAAIGPGAKAAVPTLVKALREVDEWDGPTLAYALGKIGPEAAIAEPVLSELLKSPKTNLALASAWALVQICPASPELVAKTLPVLTAGLTNDLPVARRGAAEALGRLGPVAKEAVPALKKAANDKDEGVRQAATKALGFVGGLAVEK